MKPQDTRRPSILTGALIGGLLTAPLMALFYLGEQIAGLPLVPLDIFDGMSRVLPGGIITFGIDTMVSLIEGLNLGETSTVAKMAEISMAIMLFLVIGIVTGAIFFALMRSVKTEGYRPGVILAIVAGGVLTVISLYVNYSLRPAATAAPFISFLWLAMLFLGWGIAFNWIYNDLAALPVKKAEADSAMAKVLNRRQFLVNVGGATAVLTVAGTGLAAFLGGGSSTSASASSTTTTEAPVTTGSNEPIPFDDSLEPAPGTRPEYTPIEDYYRIDISTRPPVIDEETYRLPITGLVANPVELTLDQLRNDFDPVSRFITMSCISNRVAGSLISTTKWTGLKMQDLLDLVQPTEEAGALKITGADNFDEYITMDLLKADDRIMLGYAWDDEPLTQTHGFPLRVWIPDRYGMKQPKWIISMEFVPAWDEGYWVRRGWSKEAIVNSTSVIDTVATDDLFLQDDAVMVPVGGIAYAGDRGISRVQVSVDDGEWQDAALRAPLSDTTWVIWRYDWPFAEGQHNFVVRCFEGDGTEQVSTSRGTRPDGATGFHSVVDYVREPENLPTAEATQEM